MTRIKIWNRTNCCLDRLSNFHVLVSDEPFNSKDLSATINQNGVYNIFWVNPAQAPTEIRLNGTGRYLRIQLAGINYLHMSEVEIFACDAAPPPPPPSDCADINNLAPDGVATQSSDYNGNFTANKANDGDTNAGSKSITQNETNAWWEVDLGAVQEIKTIKVVNRKDCCQDRLSDFYVFVSDAPFSSKNLSTTLNQSGVSDYFFGGPTGNQRKFDVNRTGRYVRVQLGGTNFLQLTEVKVNGCAASPKLDQETTIANLVYPNPTADKLFLDLDSYYLDKNLDYAIVNVQGQLVDTGTFGSVYTDQVELDVSSSKFSTGTYFLSLNTGDTRQVIKFVVMK